MSSLVYVARFLPHSQAKGSKQLRFFENKKSKAIKKEADL